MMKISNQGFEKSELVKIAEQLHAYRAKKQKLEIELSSEEFHKKYIPKRENTSIARIIANLPLILLYLTEIIALIIAIVICILAKAEEEDTGISEMPQAGVGVGDVAAIAIIVIGCIVIRTTISTWPIIKEEFHMLVQFLCINNPERAKKIADKYGINTYADDKARCTERINNLESQIDSIDEKILTLEHRYNELIAESKNRDDILKKHGVLNDIIPETDQSLKKSFFTLKKTEEYTDDIAELYEFYSSEEKQAESLKENLKLQLDSVNKELSTIDEDIERVKKRGIAYLCGIVIAIIIQLIVPDVISDNMGPIFIMVGLVAFFSFERASRGAIIRYLIEQESVLVSDYCFVNDVTPAKYRKQEIIEEIKQNEAMINELKFKKQYLECN